MPVENLIPMVLPACSVQFSRSVMSDSLQPHEPQHTRPPCPSPTPRVHSNLCQLSRWCHPAISSSVIPFSSCPLSLPASESFPMSQLFSSGDQSIGASASVLPVNIQGWFPLGLTSLILQSKVLSRVFPSTTIWKLQLFSAQPSLWKNSPFWFLFIFLFPVLFLPFTLYMHPLFLVLALFSWPPCGTSF